MPKPLSHLHVCSWLLNHAYLYPQLIGLNTERTFTHLKALSLPEIVNQTITIMKRQLKDQLQAKDVAVQVPDFGHFYLVEDGKGTFAIHKNQHNFVNIEKSYVKDKEVQVIDISQMSGKLYLSAKTVKAVVSAYCKAVLDLASSGKTVFVSFGVCQVGLESGKVQVNKKNLSKSQQEQTHKANHKAKYQSVWMSSLEGGLGGHLNVKEIKNHLDNGVSVTKKYIDRKYD